MDRYQGRSRSESAESVRLSGNGIRNQRGAVRSREAEWPAEDGQRGSGDDNNITTTAPAAAAAVAATAAASASAAADWEWELSVQGSALGTRGQQQQQPARPKTAHRQRTPSHNHPRYAKLSASQELEKDFPLVRFEQTEPGPGISPGPGQKRVGGGAREQTPSAPGARRPTATSGTGGGDAAGRWSSQTVELELENT